MHWPHRYPRSLGGAAFAFAGLILLFATPNASNPDVSNVAPTVAFVPPPQDGAMVPYRVELTWSGSDSDPGDAIDHYEIAIDPPYVFTSLEIAHPETAPGVTVTVRPGAQAGRDTIVVSKDVGDSSYSFLWVGTPETHGTFGLQTPNWDEGLGYVGAHRVFLRGEDLSSAISETDSIHVTAQNLPPVSQILYPFLFGEILTLSHVLNVTANGYDPDPVSATSRPVAYLIRLLRLDTLDPPISILDATPELLMEGGDSAWTRIEGDRLQISQPLAVPGSYIFGLRAVDENGNTEPGLLPYKNYFKFQAFPGGTPTLTLREPSTGTFKFQTFTLPIDVETPGVIDLHFSWSATAEAYGGIIEAYSWGVDLIDPDASEGWSSWGTRTTPGVPISFPGGTNHTFHVRVRDTGGNMTQAQLNLHVVDMTFDREALLVDDSFDNLDPNDTQHDAFWDDMVSFYLASSGLPAEQFGTYAVHGDGDRGNLQPHVPLLSDLAKYKLLVWENSGWGYNSDSALLHSTALSPVLSAYLNAGGKLWLDGRMTVAATTPDANLLGADLTYPKDALAPGDWAWDFLKLRSSKINNDKGTYAPSLFHAARWFPRPGGGFMPAIYDTMSVDINKLPLLRRATGGFSHVDAVFDPIYAESEPDFEGDIDTLYAYGAAGPEVQGKTSQYDKRLCALRWKDPDPQPVHGQVQWFGFSLYFMHQDQARDTFKRSLDWFRNDGVVPVGPVTFTAARSGKEVVILWNVVEGAEDLAFTVYREKTEGRRERLGTEIFSGERHYRFVDRNAPEDPVSYWLSQLGRTGSVSWLGPMIVPARIAQTRPFLAPVAPNPVQGGAMLAYSLTRPGSVRLTLHDVAGREVAVLVNEAQDAGRHEFAFNPRSQRMAAGVYLVRLEAEGTRDVRKMLVLP